MAGELDELLPCHLYVISKLATKTNDHCMPISTASRVSGVYSLLRRNLSLPKAEGKEQSQVTRQIVSSSCVIQGAEAPWQSAAGSIR